MVLHRFRLCDRCLRDVGSARGFWCRRCGQLCCEHHLGYNASGAIICARCCVERLPRLEVGTGVQNVAREP
jgi:hypothetical protein